MFCYLEIHFLANMLPEMPGLNLYVVRPGGSNKCSRNSGITHTHTHAQSETWPGELLAKVKLGRKKVVGPPPTFLFGNGGDNKIKWTHPMCFSFYGPSVK